MSGGVASVTASSTISGNSNYGIRASGSSALTVTNTSFSGNTNGAAYLLLDDGISFTHSDNVATGAGTKAFIMDGITTVHYTWNKDLPYIISDTLIVGSGKTLTINPGVKVLFGGSSASLLVSGSLVAEGTLLEKIIFTSLSGTPAAGDWKHIKVESGGVATLDHALIRYGGCTASCGGSPSSATLYNAGGVLNISNSEVAYSTTYGILTSGTTTAETVQTASKSSLHQCGNKLTDFSVVLFRSDFVLVSEKNLMKVLQNQWVWTMPDPFERLAGATRSGHTTAPEVQTPLQCPDMG